MSSATAQPQHSWATFISDNLTLEEFCRMLAIALQLAKAQGEIIRVQVHRVEDRTDIDGD